MIPEWQRIFDRGQETVAVWQQHSPTFNVGELTLAAHQADIALLPPAAQAVADAQDVVDDARAARDEKLAYIKDLNVRVPRKLDGDLAPKDPYHKDLEDIRNIGNDSIGAIVKRGQAVQALWTKLDERNQSATPVIPTFSIGGQDVEHLMAALGALPGLTQTVQDKEAILRDKRGDLNTPVARVDQNNKRWFTSWQGEFPPGTPEGDALGQITTEPGSATPPPPPAVPGVASITGVAVQAAGPSLVTGMAAEGAETFTVQLKDSIEETFDEVTTGATGPDYSLGTLEAGDYEIRVAGRNAQGLGPWSPTAPFTVPSA